jgi:DNA-binding response OmpR family regulator
MDVKPIVLIIDDDAFVQKVLKRSLFEQYDVYTASNGTEGLDMAVHQQPCIILLDVEMPDKNGFEVCRQLKMNEATRSIPVVFISSRGSLEERIKGFELGADDYLIKPCSQEILLHKLGKLNAYLREKSTLKKYKEDAEKTALEALTTSSELGKAIRFVERTYTLRSYSSLASALIDVGNFLSLNTSLMFETREGKYFYSSSSPQVAPLEQQVVELLHDNTRFHDFGARTQINYPQVAILIKNMPVNDSFRYGRIKDVLPFVLAATDAKLQVLDAEYGVVKQGQNLARSVDVVKMTLSGLSENLRVNQSSVESVVHRLLDEMSLRLPSMGLDDDQEQYVLETIDRAFQQVVAHVEDSQAIKQSLEGIVRLLEHLTVQQYKIFHEPAENEFKPPSCGGEIDGEDDIELF